MGNANEPRRHHYVSAFYLANFTREGKRDGTLHVLDFDKKQQRVSSPDNEGHQRDHFLIEANDPFAVETTFGDVIESPASGVIATLIAERKIPDNAHDFGLLIAFVAHLATRVKSRRLEIEQFSKDDMRYLAALAKRGKPYFNEQLLAKGVRDPEKAWRALQEYSARPEGMTRSDLIMTEIDLMRGIASLLRRRTWSVMPVTEPGLEFATCDDPVLPCGASEDGRKGYGVRETTVVVPLHRSVAVIGTMENAEFAIRSQQDFVASVNEHVMHRADRYVWSARPKFLFDWTDGQRLRDPRRAFGARGVRDRTGTSTEERRIHMPATELAAADVRRLAQDLEERDKEA